MRSATIAFYGELLRRGSNVPNVDSTASTWIVRLIESIRMPRSMQRRTTDTLTIALVSGSDAGPGQRALFYAHGWVMGGGYAIIEDARFSPGPDTASALALWRARTDSAVVLIADDRLRGELVRAVAIVLARVDSLVQRPLSGQRPARLEHHPMWREATLRISSTLKAPVAPIGETASAIIPGSQDIAWEGIPRVQVGDSRLFVLVDPHGYAPVLPGVVSSDRYAVVRASHILPLADSTRVRRLLALTPD